MDSLHIKENKMEFQILEEIKMNLLVKKENQIKMIQLIKRYIKNNIFIKIIDKMIII